MKFNRTQKGRKTFTGSLTSVRRTSLIRKQCYLCLRRTPIGFSVGDLKWRAFLHLVKDIEKVHLQFCKRVLDIIKQRVISLFIAKQIFKNIA